MVPEIGELISSCFYKGELTSAPSVRPPWLSHAIEQPVVWYTTARSAQRQEARSGTSRSNALEARAIRRLVERLNYAATHAGATLEVAVLSGYLAQLSAIERQLASGRDEWNALQLQCSSIDAFQGRECDVVIYSVTRSNPDGALGFLREEKRLNVALSRGRHALVLVGDHVFAKSAGDVANPFRAVVEFIEQNPETCSIVEVEP
jgi:superfamily I DNA and/or RNA helicase